MDGLTFRDLDESEASSARDLFCTHTDFHARHVVARLPAYFDIARHLEPDEVFFARQRIVAGAFLDRTLIGTIAIEPTHSIHEVDLVDSDAIWDRFTEHEVNVYCTLTADLERTYIGAPPNTLTAHSLAVHPDHRRRGIARSLLVHTLAALTHAEQRSLYIETARNKHLVRLCESVGFVPVRRTFSLSERLGFGSWGSVLFRYNVENRR